MNAVEIEEAVSRLAESPFDAEEFPFAFLEAFGNKATTLKRLRSEQGSSNQSDLAGAVLQRSNILIKVCELGEVGATLAALRKSPATTKQALVPCNEQEKALPYIPYGVNSIKINFDKKYQCNESICQCLPSMWE